jgi:hypothetical protein
MASVNSITVTPATITKGTKAAVTLSVTNNDRTSTITGVDENGVSVTGTYNVHETLTVTVVTQALTPNTPAPAGSIVVWTDSASDVLSTNPGSPFALTLQT